MKSNDQYENEIVELEKRANQNKSGNPNVAKAIFSSCTTIANSGVKLGIAATNTLVSITKACLKVLFSNNNK